MFGRYTTYYLHDSDKIRIKTCLLFYIDKQTSLILYEVIMSGELTMFWGAWEKTTAQYLFRVVYTLCQWEQPAIIICDFTFWMDHLSGYITLMEMRVQTFNM